SDALRGMAAKSPAPVESFGIAAEAAEHPRWRADGIEYGPSGTIFNVHHDSECLGDVETALSGAFNVRNCLAAIAGAYAVGASWDGIREGLRTFRSVRRRMEIRGEARGVTVIDDFAHNPDKIAATLATLHAFPGRVLACFQPHGYGPLRTMRRELIGCFAEHLREEDVLILSDPVYYGGTTDRSVGSGDIAEGVRAAGRKAEHIAGREASAERLAALARPGDRILVMGARDDSLAQFARDLLARL
nr:Mur ligase family protein [Pseudomonadota bacterium]